MHFQFFYLPQAPKLADGQHPAEVTTALQQHQLGEVEDADSSEEHLVCLSDLFIRIDDLQNGNHAVQSACLQTKLMHSTVQQQAVPTPSACTLEKDFCASSRSCVHSVANSQLIGIR